MARSIRELNTDQPTDLSHSLGEMTRVLQEWYAIYGKKFSALSVINAIAYEQLLYGIQAAEIRQLVEDVVAIFPNDANRDQILLTAIGMISVWPPLSD